jgi:hypothetical protein
MKRPREVGGTLADAGFATPTRDLRLFKLKALVSGKYEGFTLQTNQWGMRDKEYAKNSPQGCFRIAILGDSHSMGHGVEQEQNFESLVEELLNREDSTAGTEYEILNFSVSGYRPPAQIHVLKHEALAFKPAALLYVGHDGDAGRCVNILAVCIRQGIAISDPFLINVLERAGVNGETPEPVILRDLAPFGEDILLWVYKSLVEICKENAIRPIFVYMPTLAPEEDSTNLIRLATQAGFDPIDLTGVYDGQPPRLLQVADWDNHPNPIGHQLVAQRLYRELTRAPSKLSLSAASSR